MRKFSLVKFSVEHPRLVVVLTLLLTTAAMTQFPKIKIDTNPKHMLPDTSDVRVWNDEVDRTFGLYEDMIVVGISNDRGIDNSETLAKIGRITDGILRIRGVASRDVNSFTTITNVTAEAGTLRVAPLMGETPKSEEEIKALKETLFGNPLFLNRIISKDGKTAAVYVPIEKGSNGKVIADDIREILKKEAGEERFYIAGDPVARDTFGTEMFKLMAVFAPLAGMVMLMVRYLMFRDVFLSVTLMMDAMISIVWSMGLLIALGFPVHIMSSMAPVFLMAIATDSIHIFNEFYFRYREKRDKKTAIIETMNAVSRPVRYTAMATAAGFAVLLFMNIIPVKVFGGLIAFGTLALRILSFSFIPAMFTFVREDRLEKASVDEDVSISATSRFLMTLAGYGTRWPKATVLIGFLLFAASIAGITRIVVNNNMVEWFKKNSEVRIADREINNALGGTSLGYIIAISAEDDFIKRPETMRYLEGLQRHLEKLPEVGKTFSVADYVKRINLVLHDNDKGYDSVPDTKEAIGQYLFLFSMSAKQSDLDNVVDPSFKKANIWVQLKTWDAGAMEKVIKAADEYRKAHPLPLDLRPAGIAYFNLVWNNEVLWDMVRGFVLALVAVFLILAVNFRSFKWAVVGYIPLVFTVLLIYGVIGFSGKKFDMPISVLSCLSLGMAVDFAIHFINRFRQRLTEVGAYGHTPLQEQITECLLWTAARPGKGIMRNAVLFASAFSVMLFAPLTPYITVGAFIVSMMLLSAILTIIYLPALIVLARGWLFNGGIMMKRLLLILLVLLLPLTVLAFTPDEIMKNSQTAFLYPGKDYKARVMMRLTAKEGTERIREMTMLRKNFGESGGDQKYFIYFYQPSDVRDMTFMVWKYPKKDDDRWLFIPALNMVRRIAASDRRSSFVGSDFTYEDISGRDIEDDNHSLIKEEKVGDRDCYVIKSVPKDEKGTDYAYKLSWVDKERWLPLKEEYQSKKGELQKVFTADEVKEVSGFWTITKRTMKNMENGHRTEVAFQKVEYNLNIEDDLFTERFLKKVPKRWIE